MGPFQPDGARFPSTVSLEAQIRLAAEGSVCCQRNYDDNGQTFSQCCYCVQLLIAAAIPTRTPQVQCVCVCRKHSFCCSACYCYADAPTIAAATAASTIFTPGGHTVLRNTCLLPFLFKQYLPQVTSVDFVNGARSYFCLCHPYILTPLKPLLLHVPRLRQALLPPKTQHLARACG